MIGSILARERLSDRIRSAKDVALLVAPAGCGKSIALGAYLASRGEPHLRFDVRSDNGGLLGFSRGFSEAIDAACGTSLRESVADAVMSASATPSPGESLAQWMLEQLCAYRGTIAIDDMHLAVVDPDCAALIERLVRETVPRVRWILCGRGTGCLPAQRWVSEGLATIAVTDADLRFTSDEARAVSGAYGLQVPDADVDELLCGTAGWAAALCMALRLRQRSRSVLDAVAAAHELSYDYLADQMYAILSERERSLLSIGVLLPEIDAAVLIAAGFDDAAEMLDQLHRRYSFLAPIGDAEAAGTPTRYRCHDLFADFLAHRVDLLDEAARRAARERAARALERCGRLVPALRLYVHIGLTGDTLRLLESNVIEFLVLGHADTVSLALASLPQELADHAAPLYARGQMAHQSGRHAEAIPFLERAMAVCRDRVFATHILFVWTSSMLMCSRNPLPRLEEAARHEADLPVELRAELGGHLALSYGFNEWERDISELCERTERLAESGSLDARARSRILANLGRVAYRQGRSQRAIGLFERAAESARAAGSHHELCIAYEGLAATAEHDGDLVSAIGYARRAYDAAASSGFAGFRIGALRRQVLAYGLAGMQSELDRAVCELRTLARGTPDPALAFGEAMAAAWDGDFGAAHRNQALLCESPRYAWEGQHIAQARSSLFLAADGRHEEAAEYARYVLAPITTTDWSRASCRRYVEIAAALCAIALYVMGRRGEARRAIALRSPAEAPLGKLFLELANAIVEGAPLDAHFAAIEGCRFSGHALLVRAALAKLEPAPVDGILAPAELVVLQLLSEGATPKHVAAERGCSLYTVRKHIARIARKLECSGYRQAVRVARKRGYIPDPERAVPTGGNAG